MVLNWIVQPVLGAVIGSVTNYIAIKMMFRPYTEKYIFGKKLPFTPGIIPARRKDIACAIGQMVEDNLIGRDEIWQALLEDKMVKKVRQEIMDYHVNIPVDVEGKKSPGDIAAELFCKLDIKEVVAREAAGYIREKIEGNFFGKFIGEKMITEISEKVGEWAEYYMENQGSELIKSGIDNEVAELADMRIEDILKHFEFDTGEVEKAIEQRYCELAEANYEKIAEELHIAKIVEDKINGMDIAELEKMLIQLMKKELNTLVYLGAAIGLLIGIAGIFI